MSFIRPGIDAQHLIDRAVNAKGLGTLGKIEDVAESMRYNQMNDAQRARYTSYMDKKFQTDRLRSSADDTLTKIGYLVKHKDNGSRIVERYNSSWVQQKLKEKNINFSETDLLKGVTKISGECDLRTTSITALPDLKKINGTLILDTSSAIKNLSGIKEIGGSLLVHARSKEHMKQFLEAIQLPLQSVKGNIVPIIKSFI